jgi:hypothetical protein
MDQGTTFLLNELRVQPKYNLTLTIRTFGSRFTLSLLEIDFQIDILPFDHLFEFAFWCDPFS